jgi:hypothetical protein
MKINCMTFVPQLPFSDRLSWMAACFLAIVCAAPPFMARAQTGADGSVPAPVKTQVQDRRDAKCKIVYLGIVGGLETSNNSRSGVVQLRDTLREQAYSDVCAKSFSPYVWPAGLHWVLKHFPAQAGPWTSDELVGAPKVIIVGHSLGGWGALSVARSLKRRNIPVELTIQIDSVGFNDHTVPANVKAAAIFHARDVLMFLTTKTVSPEDASRTKLVENVLVPHAGHESVTRDPRIRALVLSTVDSLRGGSAILNNRME